MNTEITTTAAEEIISSREMEAGENMEASQDVESGPDAEAGQNTENGHDAGAGQNVETGQDAEAGQNTNFSQAGEAKSLLAQSWYKAGDIDTTLFFYISGTNQVNSDKLTCCFEIPTGQQGADSAGEWDIKDTEYGEIQIVPGEASYTLAMHTEDDVRQPDYQLRYVLDESPEHIAVSGDGPLSGEYYSIDVYREPDVFRRYMTEAELCLWSEADLYYLRNEVYAVHGRQFDSDRLRRHFDSKPWYRGEIAPEDFQEDVLSDWEKQNVALIRKLEDTPYTERAKLDGIPYDMNQLEPAPYLKLLQDDRETGLHMNLTTAKDMGIYTVVQGDISVPLTITPSQLSAVRQGEALELVMNQVTGETWILTTRAGQEYPAEREYLFYRKGTKPEPYPCDVNFSMDYESGLYRLWQLSDDTIMKVVYEGEIYLLKGAVSGAYASLSSASHIQKEITFPEPGQGDVELYGNYLRHNGLGYFTAVYYLGD
ncbi:MAG: DUF4454 domain-containing protein [Eubacteriales bacterium]|nr:DUF4454 domain-containing protein [Eubacteriales bacterium]